MIKICTKCKLEKSFDDFYKCKNKKHGLSSQCKDCESKRKKIFNATKPKKEYDKEKIKEINKRYYLNNKEKIKEKVKEYYSLNQNKIKIKNKYYYSNNKEKINKQKNNYHKLKIKFDSLYKLTHNIKGLIHQSIKRKCYSKKTKTYNILGCTYDEFKIYLESKFELWMNWNNHGLYNGELNYGWDIDHIIPLSSAKNEKEVLKLNHYTNLQPLCSKINRDIKRDK
jgi:hypothetical protein